MKKLVAFFLIITLTLCASPIISFASDSEEQYENSTPVTAPEIKAESALLMEASTGKILYSSNELKAASPASVTKIMTLLLVAEALDDQLFSLNDKVSISAYAASMGGSQVFLEEGETMTVEELIKCTVIASANDAAVALAELCSGTEDAFVEKMNLRGGELGLVNTSFENVTGLDDDTVNHYSCARDIAVMSRELIKHDIITKYSSLWQDTIRNGEFTLTNTNRLVRYYEGCNGLKTGSTDKAGYCVSTTAKRGNLQLIAVIMGAESRDARNAAARALLDMGFAGYTLCEYSEEYVDSLPLIGGRKSSVPLYSEKYSLLLSKADAKRVERTYEVPENTKAPVKEGESIGRIIFTLDGETVGECGVLVSESVEKIEFFELLLLILKRMVSGE